MNALTLPDIARQTTTADLPLDWVGMQGIALPVQIGGQRVAAEADAGVSLDDPQARGIHMSRLYLALAELEQGELDLPACAPSCNASSTATPACRVAPTCAYASRRCCGVRRWSAR